MVTLYFKVSLLQCNYTLINYIYLLCGRYNNPRFRIMVGLRLDVLIQVIQEVDPLFYHYSLNC